METNTQTKWFILLLAPILAVFICRLPGYLLAFSQPWEEVLPAPPANSVMIAGATGDVLSRPNFVRTKDGQYYHLLKESKNNNKEKWKSVEKVNKEARNNLIAGQYKLSNPLIPFLFNRPPGTVIDHFYTEHVRIESGAPRYRVSYVLLDGGTLWSWSDALTSDEYRFFNRFSVIYAVIVFGVTGVMLLVMKCVGRSLPFRKPNQLILLIFISLFIGIIPILYHNYYFYRALYIILYVYHNKL